MALTREQIKTAALQLDPSERESLAEELLLSLGDGDRESIDAAWLGEARRRDADYADGRTGAKPAEHVINRLLGKARRA
jgi:putative addiction module component (TIGR02574 family)